MKPLPDFTDAEWAGILETRAKLVNGRPDAKGAYEWLRSRPDAMAISRRIFDERVAAKLLETKVPPRLRGITDDEWLEIMRIRSTLVRGQPDAQGAWTWLKQQGVNIGRTAFCARVAAKLQSMPTAGASTAGEVGATPTATLVTSEPAGKRPKLQTEPHVPQAVAVSAPPPVVCSECEVAKHWSKSCGVSYVVTHEGVEQLLCAQCYGVMERALVASGGCNSVVRRGSDKIPQITLVRGPSTLAATEAARHASIGEWFVRLDVSVRNLQGSRRTYEGGEHPVMDELMKGAWTDAESRLCTAVIPFLPPAPTTGAPVTLTHNEMVNGVRLTEEVPAVPQVPHIDTQPRGGCQVIKILHGTNVHIQVFDAAAITLAKVVAAVSATPEQRACPLWNALLDTHHRLLAAALLCEREPAFVGFMPAGSVLALADGEPHAGDALPVSPLPRALLIASATRGDVEQAELTQLQFLDIVVRVAATTTLYEVCMVNPVYYAHVLAPVFVERADRRQPSGNPELTWTPRQWALFRECLRAKTAPTARLCAELTEQARHWQRGIGGQDEPGPWQPPVLHFKGTPGSRSLVLDTAQKVQEPAKALKYRDPDNNTWHAWVLKHSAANADGSVTLAHDGGCYVEVVLIPEHSCGCSVTFAVRKGNNAARTIRTIEVGPNDTVLIVPSAVKPEDGTLMSTWAEHEEGKFEKRYGCFDAAGVPMRWGTPRVTCETCELTIVDSEWRSRTGANEGLEDMCNSCFASHQNQLGWNVARHEEGGPRSLFKATSKKHTVATLRAALTTLEQPKQGTKADLLKRLRDWYLRPEQLEANRASWYR
jgi:hypothetical protein